MCFNVCLRDKLVGAERTVFGKWFQRNGVAQAKEGKPFDIFLNKGIMKGLKKKEL